jgi:uncharacterized membrane protein
MTQERIVESVRSDGGAVAVLSALSLTALLGFAALAVDVGALYAQRRALQSATDAAAMAAVFPPSGSTAAITAASALSIAQKSMLSNKITTTALSAVPGVYCVDSTIARSARFTSPALPYQCVNADYPTQTNNAVHVTSTIQSPYYFARIFAGATGQSISASAIATKIDEAGFMAGSGLLNLSTSQSPIFNALFSALLPGTSVNLTVADYNALLATNVMALDFFNALATRLSVTSGTYDQLLNSSVDIGTVLNAAVDALNTEGNVAGVQAGIAGLTKLAAQITGQRMITIGQLFDLGVWQNAQLQPSSAPAALQAGLNLFQLATASAQLANGQNAVDVSSLINLAPIATVTASLKVGQPLQSPMFAFGPVGASVHTAQVQLTLNLSLLAGLVKIPLYIEIAPGNAALMQIACGASPATDATMTVLANGGVVTVSLFSMPAAGIVGGGQLLTFTQTDISQHNFQRVGSEQLLTSLNNTLSLGSLGSLVGAAQKLAVSLVLTPLATLLDSAIDQLLYALGIQVGYIDIYPTGVRCGVPALVQ